MVESEKRRNPHTCTATGIWTKHPDLVLIRPPVSRIFFYLGCTYQSQALNAAHLEQWHSERDCS